MAAEVLLEPFLKQTLKDELASTLYALDYGISDARAIGTTDATLQKYFRKDCSSFGDSDTIEFTKNIARGYGLTGKLAETAAVRAHAGAHYLQYIYGGTSVLDDIAYLQEQVDPSKTLRVDTFVLFACGLNTPRRDALYVTSLKTCMKK